MRRLKKEKVDALNETGVINNYIDLITIMNEYEKITTSEMIHLAVIPTTTGY